MFCCSLAGATVYINPVGRRGEGDGQVTCLLCMCRSGRIGPVSMAVYIFLGGMLVWTWRKGVWRGGDWNDGVGSLGFTVIGTEGRRWVLCVSNVLGGGGTVGWNGSFSLGQSCCCCGPSSLSMDVRATTEVGGSVARSRFCSCLWLPLCLEFAETPA